MASIYDYFFSDYVPPQEQRHRYVVHNGVEHASETDPRDPEPGEEVELRITSLARLPIDRIAIYYTTDGQDPIGAFGMAANGTVVMATKGEEVDYPAAGVATTHWRALLPGQVDGTLVCYRIDGWSSKDPRQHWPADVSDHYTSPAVEGRDYAYHVDQRNAPPWFDDAIIYQIFVDRFAAASDQPMLRDPGHLTGFFGGTLRGITEHLDYLVDLGVNCLWLSPIMASPSYHGYDPSSFTQGAERYGTNADLRALIATAHARGLRILLDFVANHTSTEHPAFQSAQRDPRAPERAWYSFGPQYSNGYLAYYGVPSMPVLDTASASVRTMLIAAARAWLEDFCADGLRLDNVSGPAHAFWTIFQEGIKSEFPDALTLGEVTGGLADMQTYAGRLDAVMDFPATKWLRRVFAQRDSTLRDLLDMLTVHEQAMPARMGRARLLDNHDMHRFLWLAEGDAPRLQMALSCLMMLTGTPILYYGTEVGVSQRDGPPGKDVYAREPMRWGKDQRADLLEHPRWLLKWRHERVELRHGHMGQVEIHLDGSETRQVGALVRWRENAATVAIFNNHDTAVTYRVLTARLQACCQNEPPSQAWLLSPTGIGAIAPELAGELPAMSTVFFAW